MTLSAFLISKHSFSYLTLPFLFYIQSQKLLPSSNSPNFLFISLLSGLDSPFSTHFHQLYNSFQSVHRFLSSQVAFAQLRRDNIGQFQGKKSSFSSVWRFIVSSVCLICGFFSCRLRWVCFGILRREMETI